MGRMRLIGMVLVLSAAVTADAQFNSGSTGADSYFEPLETTEEVDLRLADTGPGHGTYDAEHWAIVFNFTYVQISEGVTVKFRNHASGAPVIWLVQGDVTIDGIVNLDGQPADSQPMFTEPGPGGFGGGRKGTQIVAPSAGLGPGGGNRGRKSGTTCDASASGCGGGYGTAGEGIDSYYSACDTPGGAVYGNLAIQPLIGGSGGAGSTSNNGGAGGGAILIAATGTITVNGQILARGGSGSASSGSGGAIRLVATRLTGTGSLIATGGTGGNDGGEGRIRLEAHAYPPAFTGIVNPPPSIATPGGIFPPLTVPQLYVSQIDNEHAPTYPDAGIVSPDISVFGQAQSTVTIGARNIPLGTTVTVRVVPEYGEAFERVSSPLAGGPAVLTATAQVQFPAGIRSEIQLRANWQP